MKLNVGAISRLLTLRYDPAQKPIRKRLTPLDFTPFSSHRNNIVHTVSDLIEKEFLNKYDELKFKQISLALSGGVDSRLTLAIIRTVLPDVKINCVSIGFGDEDDEIDQAKVVANTFDCNFDAIILDNIFADLPKLISVVREPRWNLYQYYAFEHGKRRSTDIFYTGDGGDELFGGYTFRYQKFLSLLAKNAGWKAKTKLYLSCHERDWVPDQNKMFGPAIKFSWERIYQLFRPYFSNGLEPLNQVFLADFNGKLLYDWLPTNKAFSDFLQVKIESVFLTDAMIKLAAHIPWQEKYDPEAKIGKIPLRSILVRQKGNEEMMKDNVKKGFSMNLTSLWKRNAREIVSTYVNAECEVVRNRIISKDWVIKTTQNLKQGDLDLNSRYINKMMSILALEIWYRLFVSKNMNPRQRL